MKTIGLIGGMGWPSTAEYYRLLNEGVNDRLGSRNSAQIILYSVNLDPMARLQKAGQWDEISAQIIDFAQRLEAAGAECILLCCNTVHKIAEQIESAIHVPFLHIVDAAGRAIQSKNLKTVGLLGSKFVMEDGFYMDRLKNTYGIQALLPGKEERQFIDNVIYDELCQAQVVSESQQRCCQITESLAAAGAEGIVLACTELMLLFEGIKLSVPVFDSTRIHAETAVKFATEPTFQ
ncbi:MAG: aspartate/glutamate racemase family protein [Sedimentisphaerales bacterium]|nr:aspartate/glutamate racemase family protein [Sedimentisphaerales bacterium]